MSGIKITRRNFLKSVSMGALGVISIGYLGGKLFAKKSDNSRHAFSKNSIFSPKEKQI